MSGGESSSKDRCGSLGLRRRYSSTWGMSFSLLWVYLLNLGSQGKGTTTYGLNRWDLSRWEWNSLTRRVWLINTITVRHWAQSTRLHGIENLKQKVLIRTFCKIQLSTAYIVIEHLTILGSGVTFRRSHSFPYSYQRPLIIVGLR